MCERQHASGRVAITSATAAAAGEKGVILIGQNESNRQNCRINEVGQCRVKQSVAADAECATRKSPVKLTSERSLKYIDKSGVRKSTVALSDETKYQSRPMDHRRVIILWGYQAQMLRADLRNTRGTSDDFPSAKCVRLRNKQIILASSLQLIELT